MKLSTLLFLCAALLIGDSAQAQSQDVSAEPVIVVDGVPFATWADYTSSDVFLQKGYRCSKPENDPARSRGFAFAAGQADCSLSQTITAPQYDPAVVYDIPVVVHVITSSTGQGAISDSLVQSQIDILNEDFLAVSGTNGAGGNNALIQFHLATVDPQGNPTNGITNTANTSWYNDSGNYYDTLAWDTNRYLNIYTNQASGALGYVPNLPQGGIVGSNSDRVVVLWSSFGRNAPIGSPFNLGRTTTHEVGHYLGLDHTFAGGCASAASCSTNGDLICDTNPESSPFFGCSSSRTTCSSSDPIDNYMDYSDDICMEQFTPNQVNRMRCTLENWRTQLFTIRASSVSRNGSGSNPNGFAEVAPAVLGSSWDTTVDIITPAAVASAIAMVDQGPDSLAVGSGELLIDISNSFVAPLDLAVGAHSIPVPNSTQLLGVTFYTQAATFSPGDLRLNNAIDVTFGF